jgi:hypothetical protein
VCSLAVEFSSGHLLFIFIKPFHLSLIMLFSGIVEGRLEDKGQVQQTSNTATRSPQVSLSRIILSLDSNVSKQHALQHLLNALQVLHARDAVVAALSSHSNIAGFTSAGKSVAYYHCKLSFLFIYLFTYLLTYLFIN